MVRATDRRQRSPASACSLPQRAPDCGSLACPAALRSRASATSSRFVRLWRDHLVSGLLEFSIRQPAGLIELLCLDVPMPRDGLQDSPRILVVSITRRQSPDLRRGGSRSSANHRQVREQQSARPRGVMARRIRDDERKSCLHQYRKLSRLGQHAAVCGDQAVPQALVTAKYRIRHRPGRAEGEHGSLRAVPAALPARTERGLEQWVAGSLGPAQTGEPGPPPLRGYSVSVKVAEELSFEVQASNTSASSSSGYIETIFDCSNPLSLSAASASVSMRVHLTWGAPPEVARDDSQSWPRLQEIRAARPRFRWEWSCELDDIASEEHLQVDHRSESLATIAIRPARSTDTPGSPSAHKSRSSLRICFSARRTAGMLLAVAWSGWSFEDRSQ